MPVPNSQLQSSVTFRVKKSRGITGGQTFCLGGRDLKCAVLAAVLMVCVNRRHEQTEQNLEKAVIMFKG